MRFYAASNIKVLHGGNRCIAETIRVLPSSETTQVCWRCQELQFEEPTTSLRFAKAILPYNLINTLLLWTLQHVQDSKIVHKKKKKKHKINLGCECVSIVIQQFEKQQRCCTVTASLTKWNNKAYAQHKAKSLECATAAVAWTCVDLFVASTVENTWSSFSFWWTTRRRWYTPPPPPPPPLSPSLSIF